MLDLKKINIDNLKYLKSTTSTNDVALEMAKQNMPEYSCCIAEEQTKGRGRLQNIWQTYPYKSLAFSFVLYDFKDVIPLVLCCSLYRVLKDEYKSKVAIKWPNDIYYDDKKLSGILVESFQLDNALNRAYIVGIGLNIFSEEGALDMVGFLEDTTDTEVTREGLLSKIFVQIKKDISKLNSDGFLEFRDYFMQNCMYLNQPIKVNMYNKVEEGTFIGINNQGYLILKQKEVILNIPAGQIVQQKNKDGQKE